MLFIGHNLLGFSEKEVGYMTLRKLMKLYRHYQDFYDFKLSNTSFAELEKKQNQSDEWIPD